jgi:hypothetical protein
MSYICADCGTDTTPCPGEWEYYMVHNTVWSCAQMKGGFLCVGCLEARLGRKLEPCDFTDVIGNDPDNPWHSVLGSKVA